MGAADVRCSVLGILEIFGISGVVGLPLAGLGGLIGITMAGILTPASKAWRTTDFISANLATTRAFSN
jgi:hypothetical protein